MRTMAVGALLAAAVGAAAMGTVLAEDDLTVVKRAVARQGEIGSSPRHVSTGEEPSRLDTRPAVTTGREPRWFKVRVIEKGSKKARVNVNLPIALVRALGDDFPIDFGRHGRNGRRDGWRGDRSEKVIRLGEILATLEAGQALVEIDDDDATVRVWVE